MPGAAPADAARRPEELARWLRSEGIRRVLVGGFDLRGLLRGKSVTVRRFLGTLDAGMPLCAVDVAPSELDASGRPQPCTLHPAP